MNIAQFVREVRQEASKVTWPTRRETSTTTVMVFIMVFLAAVFLFFTDQLLSFVVQKILDIGS